MSHRGGLVVSLRPGGFGERLGLQMGDRLLSLNGHRLRDVIDFHSYGAEEEVEVSLEREGAVVSLRSRRACGQPWGVDFAEPLFDGTRTCDNHCPFCFLNGLPGGLRPSLYLRDDHYRLSFLFGNFCTLSNLREGDWQRLAEQRLSPLYVSVQATEYDLRRRLLGARGIPDIVSQLRRLGEIGITVEAQVVVCPGLNDGVALERTLADLWGLRETVESVALVPVGLTRHHSPSLRPVARGDAERVLAWADAWRRRAYRETGRRFVYPSDEFYLLAGRRVPGSATYDGFPQLANGVGLVRRFLDGWAGSRRRLARRPVVPAVRSATLVTGRAFVPFLAEVAGGLGDLLGVRCEALGVSNRLLGERVTVAGLLAAQDVVEQLAGCELGEVVVLPRSMFDAAGERTLDDWAPEQIALTLGRPVAVAGSPSELAAILTGARLVGEEAGAQWASREPSCRGKVAGRALTAGPPSRRRRSDLAQ